MSIQKLELSADTVLVKLYGGVTGITRRTVKEETEHEGRTEIVSRETETTQADAQEASKAKKLLNQLRSTVDKYCTTVVNITVTTAGQLSALRTEIAPVQAQIDDHNRAARFHKIDRALFCAPIALRADPAALIEICRQISDELRVARAFFEIAPLHPVLGIDAPANLPGGAASLAAWLKPVDNWVIRTKGLATLFPTITGQVIGEGIASVKDLRTRVADLARAGEKAGQSPESALRTALQTVNSIDGAFGLLDSAIGLTVITDSTAKEASDSLRAEGGGVEVH